MAVDPNPGDGASDPGKDAAHTPGTPVAVCTTCGCTGSCACDKTPLLSGGGPILDLPAGVESSSYLTSPSPSGASYSSDGSGSLLDRAASLQNTAAQVGVTLPRFPIPGDCGDQSGPCGAWMNLQGNLVRQVGTPSSGGFAPQVLLTYNSTIATLISQFGRGWLCNLNSRIATLTGGLLITDGIGTARSYTGTPTAVGSYYTPPPGAVDSVVLLANGWAQVQPNGTSFVYDSTGLLSQIQSANGTWSLIRSGSQLNGITDPAGGTTALSYVSGNLTQITDPAGRVTQFSIDGTTGELQHVTSPTLCVTALDYNDNHLLTNWTTPAGISVSYSYDADFRLTGIQTPTGNLTTIAYATNQLTITDARGHAGTYLLNTDGTLKSYTDALSHATSYTWDSGWPRSITDSLGSITTFGYATLTRDPGLRRLASIQFPGGGIFSYQMDSNDRLQTVIDELGNVGTLTWNGNLRTSFINPLGQVTTYGYSGSGAGQYNQLAAITNPLGNTFSLSWDASGVQTADINPLGQITSYTANDAGQRIAVQNALGCVTSCMRDDMNRILDCEDALGNVTTYTYQTGTCRLSSQTNPLGEITSYIYDQEGRQEATIDPLGNRTTSSYDPVNNLAAVTNPLGYTTSYTYDAVNRQQSMEDALGNITTYGYDGVGDRTSVMNPLGFISTTVYDAQRRQIASVDALGNRTSFSYDLASNQRTRQNPLGFVWTSTYDPLNRRVAAIDPLGFRTTTVYDAASETIAQVSPLGIRTTNIYDPARRMIGRVDGLGNLTSLVFDAAGRQYQSISALGIVTSTIYDPADRMIGSVDGLGNVSTTVYDAASQAIARVTPLGFRTTMVYDAAGRQYQTQNALGFIASTIYDPGSQVIGQVTPLGNRTTLIYDPAGRQYQTQNPLGFVASTIYDAASRAIASVTPLGFATTTVYDQANRTIVSVDPLGHRTTSAYDAASQLQTVTTPLGFVSVSNSYDPAGRRTAAQDGIGAITSFVYDHDSRQIALQNARGYVTTTVYDNANRAVARVNALGNIFTTVYDNDSRTIGTMSALGNATTFGYDLANRRITTLDAENELATTVYDNDSRTIGMVSPLGFLTSFIYDSAARQTQVINPLGFVTTMVYDHDDRRTAVVDANGNVTTSVYDKAARTIAVQNALGYLTTNVYDQDNRRVQLLDANGSANTFVYDAAARQTNRIDPLGRVTTYGYDLNDRLTKSLDARGVLITNSYDNDNRLTGQLFPDGSQNTFTYDPVRNRTQLQDPTGTSNWGFDPLNLLATAVDPQSKSVSYSYDADNRRVQMLDPDMGDSFFAYDKVNRLKTLVNPNDELTTWAYDLNSRMVSVKQANEVTAQTIYDAGDRILNLQNVRADLSLVSGFTYTYDKLNNRQTVLEADGSRTSWTYDSVYQLLSENRTGTGAGGVSFASTYTYDPVGNRQTRNDAATGLATYTYNSANQLNKFVDSTGTTTFTYDNAGNRTLRQQPAAGNTTYAWDYQNLMTVMNSPTASMSFVYDGEQRRVERSSSADGVTRFVYDLKNILLETDGGGQTQRYYTVSGTMPGQFGDLVSERFPHATPHAYTEFYAFDALGSTDSLTDDRGMTTDHYVYTAFGAIASPASSPDEHRTFVGRFGYQDDAGSGVYFADVRYYEADTGRWLSPDPIWPRSGGNPYDYGNNNPTNGVDPTGLQGIQIWNPLDVFGTTSWGPIDTTAAAIPQRTQSIEEIIENVTASQPTAHGDLGDARLAESVEPLAGGLQQILEMQAGNFEFDANALLRQASATLGSVILNDAKGVAGPIPNFSDFNNWSQETFGTPLPDPLKKHMAETKNKIRSFFSNAGLTRQSGSGNEETYVNTVPVGFESLGTEFVHGAKGNCIEIVAIIRQTSGPFDVTFGAKVPLLTGSILSANQEQSLDPNTLLNGNVSDWANGASAAVHFFEHHIRYESDNLDVEIHAEYKFKHGEISVTGHTTGTEYGGGFKWEYKQ